MSPQTLPEQEEHLFRVLSSRRFLQMEGLSNEVPFFIYPYPPEDSVAVAEAKGRVKNRLARAGVSVFEINLYDLTVELLEARNVWTRVLEAEAELDKADFQEMLQGMLDPEQHIAPAIRERVTQADPFDIVFLTGIGEVFPYIRSHNVLNNLQSVVTGKPMVMYFPGRYEQSETLGSSLVLFGRLKDDQYYRAKNILEQEA
jgi:hypothetical protein